MKEKSRIPIITIALIVVNVLVFIFIETTGGSDDVDYMIKMGACYEPLIIEKHEYYRLFTHFFMHYGIDHLFNNMISLIVLGYTLENAIGKVRFIILYFMSGILAGVCSIVYNIYVGNEYTVSCGASGAIYGLMGALLVFLFVVSKGSRVSLFPRYILFLGLGFYSGFQDSSIDNAAHVGGLIVGIILCIVIGGAKRGKLKMLNQLEQGGYDED